MDTLSPPETRARSRSKTPFLRSSCDRELCTEGDHQHDKIRKSPNVQTIQEEPEPIPTPKVAKTTKTRQSKEIVTSQTASNISPDSTKTQTEANITTVKSAENVANVTTTTVITTSKVVSTSQNDVSSTTSRARKSINTKEISQNEINRALEKNQKFGTSTPKQNHQRSHVTISTNGDLSDHIPYKEYKEAGEYWNKYPKTDYTYSKLSPHRRELAPGIIAMPNMSRKSLDKHAERVNVMALNNPAQESYIRARYQSSGRFFKNSQPDFQYDSQDEIDLSEFDRKATSRYTTTYKVQKESIFTRCFTSIITTIYTSWYWFTNLFSRSEQHHYYYTRIEEQKRGIFSRSWSAISNAFISIFRRIYLFIATFLYVDAWLLQTWLPRTYTNEKAKRHFLWFLGLLLPVLLIGVWLLTEEEQKRAIISTIPLPLTILPTWKLSNGDLGNLFNFNFNWRSPEVLTSHRAYENLAPNIKQHLSDHEYKNLLKHIDSYIEILIREKQKSQEINENLSLYIANIVKENIVTYKYELSDADIDRIAEIVKLKLLQNNFSDVPISLSPENLERISMTVRENINLEMTSPTNKVHDIDGIILKILSSPQLINVIDQRINVKTPKIDSSKNDAIAKLSDEINQIRLQLADRLTINQNFDYNLDLLRSQQQDLADQFYNHQAANDEKFQNLLKQIDMKVGLMSDQQYVQIDNQIRTVLLDIIGYDQQMKEGDNLQNIDIKGWIRNVFVAKDMLEARLNEIKLNLGQNMEEEVQQSAGILMQQIGEKLKKEILLSIEAQRTSDVNNNLNVKVNVDELEVKRIVKQALAIYDADKTGMVDYALESAGGQVLSTRCTENYHTKTAQISVFGIPLWYPTNTPRTVISPAVQPGQCWAFQGFPGFLVLKLNVEILVTGFTMEHIPKSLAPNGQIDSAPKDFTVWGLLNESDQEPVLFGKYEYVDDSTSLQYFPVQNKDITRLHQVIELRIETNHGNPTYTCLYRFRVHGKPQI